MRHPRPWEELGISRATWYRHGKPTAKPPRTNVAQAARNFGFPSVRTFQRLNRVLALGVRDRLRRVVAQALDEGIEPGTIERWLSSPGERRKLRKWLKEHVAKPPE
jgi:hypothetical protein